LIKDFDFLYPDKKENLLEHFPVYKEKILNLGKKISDNLKDSTLKCILNEYLDLKSGNLNFKYQLKNHFGNSLINLFFRK